MTTTPTTPEAPHRNHQGSIPVASGGPRPFPEPATRSGGSWLSPGTLIPALLVVALLGFAAFTKFAYPNPKQIAFDRLTGVLEVVIALGLVAMHRKWAAWGFIAVFFAGMAGWSAFKSYHGESCGCFAAFWEPPKFFTVALNSVIILVSLGLMAARGATLPIVTGVVSLALAASGTGWVVSDAATPPKRSEVAEKHGGKIASQRLLESDLLADVRAQPAGGPAWLIFAFDPDCHICETLKPFVEVKTQEFTETQDPVLQIRSVNIPETAPKTGIEVFAWETPTLFVVQDGAITKQWTGKTLETWDLNNLIEIYDQLAAGTFVAEPPSLTGPLPGATQTPASAKP